MLFGRQWLSAISAYPVTGLLSVGWVRRTDEVPPGTSPTPFLWTKYNLQEEPEGVPLDRDEFLQAKIDPRIRVGVVAIKEEVFPIRTCAEYVRG